MNEAVRRSSYFLLHILTEISINTKCQKKNQSLTHTPKNGNLKKKALESERLQETVD